MVSPTFLLPILLTLTLPTHNQVHASPSPQDTITSLTTITPSAETVTTYVASATTPPSPQYTNNLDFRTSILNSTNLYRYQHNATFLCWNDSLATYAQSYATKCLWKHSMGPPGENLARGYPDITTAVDAWGNERALYTFAPPSNVTGFSEATGHFTQLVWKATQTVGCGAYACNGENGIDGYMLVCEYWPPGNIEGTGNEKNVFFEENVQGQVVQGSGGFNEFSATVGATGVGTATATGSLVPTGSASATTGSSNGGRIVCDVRGEGWMGVIIAVVGVYVGVLGAL